MTKENKLLKKRSGTYLLAVFAGAALLCGVVQSARASAPPVDFTVQATSTQKAVEVGKLFKIALKSTVTPKDTHEEHLTTKNQIWYITKVAYSTDDASWTNEWSRSGHLAEAKKANFFDIKISGGSGGRPHSQGGPIKVAGKLSGTLGIGGQAGYYLITFESSADVSATVNGEEESGRITSSGTAEVIAIKIDICQNPTMSSPGAVITNITSNEVVGHRMYFEAKVAPAGVSVSSYQWSIPGKYVKDYQIVYTSKTGPTSAKEVSLPASDLKAKTVEYYWYDGADGRDVQVSADIDGISISATTTFNVKAPIPRLFSKLCDVAHVAYFRFYPNAGSYIGGYGAPLPSPYPYNTLVAIWADHNCQLPAPFTGTGTFRWVQVIVSEITTCTHEGWLGDWTEHLEPNSGLDTLFPYTTTSDFNDSPGDIYNRGHYDYKYADLMVFDYFLLYKPNGSGSINIPVAKGGWWWKSQGWRADVHNPWGFTALPGTLNQGSTPLAASLQFPEWTKNGGNYVLHWVY